MKTLLLAFLLAIQAEAQDSNLRLVGTNLYDFSRAGQYFFQTGIVTKVFSQAVTVRLTGQPCYCVVAPDWAKRIYHPFGDGMGIMRVVTGTQKSYEYEQLAAAEIVMPCYNTAIAISKLPPNQQAQAYAQADRDVQDFLLLRTPTSYIQLLHPPQMTLGQISFCAVPVKPDRFWDCGEAFTGDTNDFRFIYRLVNDKIYKTAIATNQPSVKP